MTAVGGVESSGARGAAGGGSGEEKLHSLVESVLRLERVDPNIFVARKLWRPPGARGVFGGCVLGQSLLAAVETVPPEKHVHSMHSYFLLAGKEDVPIVYTVTRLRDGRTFSSRAVSATQDGVPIFHCTASFCLDEDSEYTHQAPMPPDEPEPEGLESQEEVWERVLADKRLPDAAREFVANMSRRTGPIDIRYCDQIDPLAPPLKHEPRRRVWMRAKGRVGDSLNVHRCIAAYYSDHVLLGTAIRPHGVTFGGAAMMASLDHTLWFHAPFRADEWMLYDVESPYSGHNRGFCVGRLFTRDGQLAVSVAQEGVIRLVPRGIADKKKPRKADATDADSAGGVRRPPRSKL